MALDGQDRKQKGRLRKILNCLKRKKKWRLRAERTCLRPQRESVAEPRIEARCSKSVAIGLNKN